MANPNYPKEMRQKAKDTRQHLVTVDFVLPSGKRELCYQGPMPKFAAKIIADAWMDAMRQLGLSKALRTYRKPEYAPDSKPAKVSSGQT